MTATVERIRKEAGQLPYDEREALVHILELDLDSAVPEDSSEVEAAWDIELKNRVDDVESGKVKLLSQAEFDSAFVEARQQTASRAPRA